MTDSSRSLTPYLPPPAILSAHRARGVTALQLEYHREAMERRRRAMPALVAVKRTRAVVAAPKPKPVFSPKVIPTPISADDRLEMAMRRYRTKAARLEAVHAEFCLTEAEPPVEPITKRFYLGKAP